VAELILRPVWHNHDAAAERDVLAFWREGRLLSQDVDLATRLNELCVIGYADNNVVAVNTAVLTHLKQLRARVAMLRLAIAADYRTLQVAADIVQMAKDQLQSWAAAHPAERLMGIAAVVPTRGFGTNPNEAVWLPSGLAVIDHTDKDEQVRLAWFPNAKID
jgi:hypothetical protein